jgi:CBS domain-containing protein
MDKAKLHNTLENIVPFSFLSENERKRLADAITEAAFGAGTDLSVQNKTRIDHVYIVKTGTLEIYYDQDGEKFLSGLLKKDDIFGGISILMNQGISFRSVTVKQDAEVYRIPKREFLELCAEHKSFYRHFVDTFTRRMRDESYAAVVSASQAFLFLSGVVPFSFLPEEELEKIAAQLSMVRHPKGTVLFVQGRGKMDRLYIIQKGAAERYFEEKNEKKLSGLLGEGDLFGGISILVNDGVPVRTCRTQEDTTFYTLAKNTFLDLCQRYEAFSDYFTDTFGKRMLNRTYAGIIIRTSPSPAREEGIEFFNQPVATLFTKDIVSCSQETSIREVAQEMSRRSCSSIFIRGEAGRYVGVVTDNDLRRKVIAAGYDIEKPVADIMSETLYAVGQKTMVFEALMEMMRHNIKHLAVTNSAGDVIGMVTNSDLLTAQGQSPFFLLREITNASAAEEIFDKHQRLPRIVQNLIHSGAKARNVTALVSTIADAVLKRLIDFALADLGAPPCKFAFMILGSEGRREQTLKTDQDNAIVYEDVAADRKGAVEKYFLEFGEKVCTWLDSSGYAFCQGGVMARNPKWCQPLSVWKDYFSSWIRKAEGESLLQASIFFDLRSGFGDAELIDELHRHMFSALSGWAGFFRNLTENSLHFKPPIGFFRNFVVESKGEHRNAFDIKSAMQPIVDFARIYALHQRIEQTNTQERLHQLQLKKVLTWQDYNELDQGYSFLMQLRFVRQVAAVLEEGKTPDNYINPKKLSRLEQTMLKEIFKRIEKFQTKLGFDFTGIG